MALVNSSLVWRPAFVVFNERCAVDKAEACNEVLDKLEKLKFQQQLLDKLRDKRTSWLIRAWIRARSATPIFFSDPWRVLDFVNYSAFLVSFFIMLKVFSLVNDTVIDIKVRI